MAKTKIQKIFAPIKGSLPRFISKPLRSIATAFLTPLRFSYTSGHFKSSLQNKAVNKFDESIPWYSYPAIDFLSQKDFKGKRILEFGSGQSTIWWANRGLEVVSFEGDANWFNSIKATMPANVKLHLVNNIVRDQSIKEITSHLKSEEKFDIIIIDGLFRYELCELAKQYLNIEGCIIADNSEVKDYNFFGPFRETEFQRIDFFGFSPGVVLKQGTSLFFKGRCFLLDASSPIQLVL